jgi:hypothetical protein
MTKVVTAIVTIDFVWLLLCYANGSAWRFKVALNFFLWTWRLLQFYRTIADPFNIFGICLTHLLTAKSKAVPLHAMQALGGGRYSSYSFPFSAVDRGKWSASLPVRALPPGKGPPVPIVQEAGWASEPVWTQRKNPLPLPGTEPWSPVVQPVAKHCSDRGTRLSLLSAFVVKTS